MVVYWVYILEIVNKKNNSTYYTGYTKDLSKRIALHKSGKGARYTKNAREIKLKYTETFTSQSEALKREKAIKKLPKIKKIELIHTYSAITG
jgi:putative endonuclease